MMRKARLWPCTVFFWSLWALAGGAAVLMVAVFGLIGALEVGTVPLLVLMAWPTRSAQPAPVVPETFPVFKKSKAWLGRGVPSHVSLPVPPDWPW